MSWIVGWYSSLTRASLAEAFSSVGIIEDLSSYESRYALHYIHLNLEKSNEFLQNTPNRVPHDWHSASFPSLSHYQEHIFPKIGSVLRREPRSRKVDKCGTV